MSENLPSAPEYPWLHLDLFIGGKTSHLLTNPETFYAIVQRGISRMLAGNNDPDIPPEQRRMTLAMRTTVKGALLMFGDKILDGMFGGKAHPKPSKGDDLIEWYSNIFAKIIIASATQGTLVLHAKGGDTFGQTRSIIIDEVYTVSHAQSTGSGTAGEAERASDG